MNIKQDEGRISALSAPIEVVTFDIYRDIHKGIRAELFGITSAAGSLDPQDAPSVQAFGWRLGGLVGLLDGHAAHEDRYLRPLFEDESPALAGRVTDDHVELEGQLHALAAAVGELPAARPARRRAVHRIYLGLASFTSAYLEHQALEELEVMPTLATGHTVEELLRVNGQIVATIPPDRMAASLALLLPAMNVDDRTEMLLGIQASSPPEVFAGVRALARAVLAPKDDAVLAQRLARGVP